MQEPSVEPDERYRTLFESIDEGFCVIEKVSGDPLDFRYVEANPAFAVQTGVGDVVGKTIREAFPGEPEQWFQIYDTVVLTGTPTRFERALVTQGRMLELYAFRVNDETRRRVGVIFKDITARKEAEQNRARLSTIVETSDDAIVSKDLDGVITSWNAGAERLFGYTADEAVGRPVTMIIPPDRADEEPSVLARIRSGDKVEHYETVRQRKDGTLLQISLSVSPILDAKGRVIGASKIARDITEKLRLAGAALEADRRKTEFIAMLAHELRNPLAPILGSIDVLRYLRGTRVAGAEAPRVAGRRQAAAPTRRRQDEDHEAQALDVLQRQTNHMVRMVDDLLDVGRISHGKIELRREPIELATVISHAVEAFRPAADRRDQQLILSVPETPVQLYADPTRLAQVIGNLLNNAGKFTERGGCIWVTARRADVPGAPPEAIIEVRDSGIGISSDQLEHVFDMFTQVEKSLDRTTSGLGIGLTLVKTLTQLHGGSVEARSAGIGQGSEFVVRLPILAGARLDSPSPAMPEPVRTGCFRILIVDDNRDSAEMLAMLLSLTGHETHTAHDGRSAVDFAARLQPDAILLDIGLPGLNGYDAARAIREQAQGPAPVLIALTGWGQDDDRRRSAEAGFDAHVVKPVDEAMIRRLLAELCAGRTPAHS